MYIRINISLTYGSKDTKVLFDTKISWIFRFFNKHPRWLLCLGSEGLSLLGMHGVQSVWCTHNVIRNTRSRIQTQNPGGENENHNKIRIFWLVFGNREGSFIIRNWINYLIFCFWPLLPLPSPVRLFCFPYTCLAYGKYCIILMLLNHN